MELWHVLDCPDRVDSIKAPQRRTLQKNPKKPGKAVKTPIPVGKHRGQRCRNRSTPFPWKKPKTTNEENSVWSPWSWDNAFFCLPLAIPAAHGILPPVESPTPPPRCPSRRARLRNYPINPPALSCHPGNASIPAPSVPAAPAKFQGRPKPWEGCGEREHEQIHGFWCRLHGGYSAPKKEGIEAAKLGNFIPGFPSVFGICPSNTLLVSLVLPDLLPDDEMSGEFLDLGILLCQEHGQGLEDAGGCCWVTAWIDSSSSH